MNVAEMHLFVARNVSCIKHEARLEKMVLLFDENTALQSRIKEFFEDAAGPYGDVLQKPAE